MRFPLSISTPQKTTKVSAEPMQEPTGVYNVPLDAGHDISDGVAVAHTLVVCKGDMSVLELVPPGVYRLGFKGFVLETVRLEDVVLSCVDCCTLGFDDEVPTRVY